MKRSTTLALLALAVAGMTCMPLGAQTRSNGGNSRGRSNPSGSGSSSSQTGNTRSGGNSSRGSGSTYVSPGHSTSRPSANREQQKPATPAAKPSGSSARPSSGNASRQPSRSQGNVHTGSQTRPSEGGNSGGSVTRPSRTGSQASRPATQPSAGREQQKPVTPAAKPSGSTSGGNTRQPSRTTSSTYKQTHGQAAQGGQTPQARPQHNAGEDRNRPPRDVHDRGGAPVKFNPGGPKHGPHRIPPRRRDPMDFRHAAGFWDRGPHYFGYQVRYLPARRVRLYDMWGNPYYVVDNVYYRRYGGRYYICRPPIGVYFDHVVRDMVHSACRIAYYYNVVNTYNTINENASIIAQQNATIAANNAAIAQQNAVIARQNNTIAEQQARLTDNDARAEKAYRKANELGLVQSYASASMEYFYEDGVFYTKSADGRYLTIVPPAGAVIEELPDDYEVVVLQGDEYYKVDDTVYDAVVIDGKLYFEVLGQLTGDMARDYNQYRL